MKLRITTFLILSFMLFAATAVTAQEDSKLTPTEEQQQKEKAEKEKKAFALLEQVVEEAQVLRLPENRARVQIGAADLLWQRDQGRARSLFALAADNVTEMARQASTNPSPNERRGPNQGRTAFQLRQELVLTAARYDAPLAYQLLAATKPATVSTDNSNSGGFGPDDNLEQRLLAEIAALDPKMALQNAEQMLDKGRYSRSLAEVLAQLQAKDKEAAAKLEDKMVRRLQSANMLSSMDPGNLALSLLRPGPRLGGNPTNGTAIMPNNTRQLLAPSSYTILLGSVIDAALRATPPSGNRNQNRVRGQSSGPIGRGGDGRQGNSANEPTPAELEQNNARRLLNGLWMLLPQIDQHLPSRAQAVRQKMTDLGFGDPSRGGGQPAFRASPQSTSETLMTMASQVPPQVQSRIYQQAAMRALEEGNPDRARQIANDHLEPAARDSVLQAVEFRKTSEKLDVTRIDEVRQTLSGMRSDEERVDLLLRLSGSAAANNPKLAVELLEEARLYTNRRASNYQQFEQQLRVAGAYKDLEPSRSFEVLEPVVLQLNELLSAAATLSGFELNVFKDGELPLEARNGLSNIVTRYGAMLGQLARSDFDRSQILANRFQLTEPRLIARLAIVRGLLGLESGGGSRNPVRFGQNTVIRLPQ